MRGTLITLLIVIGLFGCNDEYKRDYELVNFMEQNIVNQKLLTEKNILIIIPMEGCGECIDPLVKHFNTQDTIDEKLKIFITSFSKKQININFEKTVIKANNVWIDKNGELQRFVNIVNTSPVIYFIENKKIISKFKHSKDNHDKLMSKVKKF